ncbi:MAG: hypothetical protein A3C90_00175 [Candidatus Magasanikbacteria bacterium RIFCSPHIGHO2_02_FULL_51_14]|uniref:Methyltransferase type 11 domain-containing protein n=1 Tax=Candidatus Magasanikbacteria bacterium RIFCSPHIGHO2_02_FULL_51_14 TaxID=1798683 RepID=A0A1F6MD06_9BACT|nr:MAG: hypothetical protein A3C90_00175 [Candidatus Magasanikbacteria bacterium RIFCSPHIGHO2_02_FULL_51_14]
MRKENLSIWRKDTLYADIFKKRALGDLPEMESSKAAAKKLGAVFTDGCSILDVGCGVGHYLVSYRKALKEKKYTYTGVDVTPEYIDIGKEIFGGELNIHFLVGSIYELPFADKSFDIVVCNNVLLHLPEVRTAIRELLRVAKKTLIIRALVGDKSYRIKDIYTKQDMDFFESDVDTFDEDGEPKDFSFYNIYSKRYVNAIIKDALPGAKVTIEEDLDFDLGEMSRNKKDFNNRTNATTVVGGMQVNGNIILPWSFVTVCIDS